MSRKDAKSQRKMKYKQETIPEFENEFKEMNKAEIRKYIYKYYKENIQGKTITNEDEKIEIYFNNVGRNKTIKGGYIDSKKAVGIKNIIKLFSIAELNKISKPKDNHIKNFDAISILNFKVKCKIDKKQYTFRIAIMIRKTGKFQYDINED